LLSALVAIVMITSVCVIPVSSDDGYAAEGDPVLKDGDAYGIYLDLNDNTINRLFSNLTDSEMGHDDIESFIAGITQHEMVKMTEKVPVYKNVEYDIDMELGFGIKQVSSDASGYTYRISVAADGDVMVSNTVTKEIAEGQNVDLTSTIDAETSIGLELTVVTDMNNDVTSVSGRIALYVDYEATEEVVTEVDPFEEEKSTSGKYTLLALINAPVINEVTYTDITLYQTGIELLPESHLRNSEPLDDSTIIERAELEKIITIFNDNTEKGKITFAGILGIIDAFKGEGSNLAANPSAILSIISLPSANGKSIENVDALPEFLFGDSGLKLSSSEENKLANATTGAINSVIDEFKDMEFDVTFYDENGEVKYTEEGTKWGQPVKKTTDVLALEDAGTDKKFLGWYVKDTLIPANLTKVYGDLEVYPLYATVYLPTEIENAINEASSGDELWVELSEGAFSTALIGSKEIIVNVSVPGATNAPVKSVVWSFSSAGGEIPIGFTSSMEKESIKIDFTHSGALPSGTTVTVDVSEKFKNGDIIDVYHIKDNNSKEAIEGYYIVQDGKVIIEIAECSSYLLEVNNGLTTIEPSVVPSDTPDDKDDGGINFILIGGIAVGIVAVIGLGAFFFLRRQ